MKIAPIVLAATENFPETFSETLLFALENTALGLIIVFSALALLFLVLKIVATVTAKAVGASEKKQKGKAVVESAAPAVANTAAPAVGNNEEEVVAAITAAISAMLEAEGKAPTGFRVVSFRRSNSAK